jgi:xylulokinase
MIIGVDIGTQSLKAVVTDRGLSPRGEASSPYQPHFPRPGWAEQDPALWERALAPTIAAALAQAGASADDVLGLGICGQLDGCVPVGVDGRALAPCIIWMDRRATGETSDIPGKLVRQRTGIVLDAGHMAAKVRWLKRNRAECGRSARFHQPVSYLVERLTGVFVMDHALASTTMVYALGKGEYDREILDLFEIDAAELPAIRDAAACAGRLHGAGAALTGLRPGTPVAVGTGDDFSTPLGAGLSDPGQVAVILGTGEVVGAIHPTPVIDDHDLVETHAYPGGAYFIENPGWLSGGALVWLASLLGVAHSVDLDALAAETSPGADGVTFLPALNGAMAPRWNPSGRGCYYGLTAAHGRGHLARAMLEVSPSPCAT